MRVSTVFIAAIVLLTVIFTGFITNYMKENILRNKEEQLITVTDTLDSRLSSLKEPLVSLSGYTPASRLLNHYDPLYSAQWMQNTRNVDTFLANINMFNDYIIDVNLVRTDSTTVYSMNDLLRSNYDYMGQEWFKQALSANTFVKFAPPHGNDHLYKQSMSPSFTVFFPVYHAERLTGYILMECDLLKLTDFFSAQHGLDSGFILMDDNHQVILDYNHDRNSLHLDSNLSVPIPDGTSISFQTGGSLYIARELSNHWIMLSENDYGIITSPIKQLLLMVALIVLVVVSLLVLISAYNSRLIKKPFDALIQRIISYDGSRSTQISEFDRAPQELAVIRTKFEEMADNMNALINDVYVARLNQKEAELEALTNQINPHFLYNVFQLIQAKAVLSDNLEIEEMIQALSRMMRYTMERRRDKVFLREELEYINYYLLFYKKRFSEMFVYEIECEPELLSLTTLKFILQPVVENCFKHAFKNKSGGKLSVNVKKEENDILFTVWDNGCGINVETLSALRRKLDGEIGESGIGIVNTNARLRLTYGDAYGITIESKEWEYTKVTLRIKQETI